MMVPRDDQFAGFCCALPVENGGGVSVGAVVAWSTGRREETITALLDARAKGFTARGQRGRIVTLGMLPYGLRLAQIIFPRQTKPVFGEGTGPDVLALGAGGKALGYMDSGRAGWRVRHLPPATGHPRSRRPDGRPRR
jgi:hypothetical protein